MGNREERGNWAVTEAEQGPRCVMESIPTVFTGMTTVDDFVEGSPHFCP